jgi:segregation and condensation protein B
MDKSEKFYHSMDTQPLHERELSLVAKLEALLFVASGSVTHAQLAAAVGTSTQEVENALTQLQDHYSGSETGHGILIQRHHGRVQLVTAPEAAALIERFLGLEASTRLSRAALEALAIIAYEEPATRPQIDAIRGVNSDGVLKSLLSKGLIQEVGRADSPGRPILYSVTPEFLQFFGLSSLSELPPLTATIPAANAEIEQKAP